MDSKFMIKGVNVTHKEHNNHALYVRIGGEYNDTEGFVVGQHTEEQSTFKTFQTLLILELGQRLS